MKFKDLQPTDLIQILDVNDPFDFGGHYANSAHTVEEWMEYTGAFYRDCPKEELFGRWKEDSRDGDFFKVMLHIKNDKIVVVDSA